MVEQDNRVDSSTRSTTATFVPAEIASMARKGRETLLAAQKEMLAALEHVNRDWWGHLNDEAGLTSDFAQRITTVKSIPDVAAAYHDMMAQQMALLSKQGQKLLEGAQGFVLGVVSGGLRLLERGVLVRPVTTARTYLAA
jgi:hypothetical protein